MKTCLIGCLLLVFLCGMPLSSLAQVPPAIPQDPRADGSLVHVVQLGDTFDAIFVAYMGYGITIEEILQRNGWRFSPQFLSVGQEVVILPSGTLSAGQAPPTNTAEEPALGAVNPLPTGGNEPRSLTAAEIQALSPVEGIPVFIQVADSVSLSPQTESASPETESVSPETQSASPETESVSPQSFQPSAEQQSQLNALYQNAVSANASLAEVAPTVEVAEVAPTVEVAEVAPTVEVAEVAPTVEVAEVAPTVEVAEVAPTVEVAEVAPTVEVAEVAPTVEVAEVAPTVEVAEVAPTVEVAEVAPTVEVAEVAPTVEVAASNPIQNSAHAQTLQGLYAQASGAAPQTESAAVAPPQTESAAAAPPQTESAAVAVPNLALGTVCVTLFEDVNLNTVQDPDEGPLAGGTFTVGAAETQTRTGLEPLCLSDQPTGLVSVLASAPDSYGITSPNNLQVQIIGGRTISVPFGAASGFSALPVDVAMAETLEVPLPPALEVSVTSEPESLTDRLIGWSAFILLGAAILLFMGGLAALLLWRLLRR